MKKTNKSKPAASHARSEWPRTRARAGYIFNINGAILNWPYVDKEMKKNAPEIYDKVAAGFPGGVAVENMQEFFIRFCEAYEIDTGDEFFINLFPDN